MYNTYKNGFIEVVCGPMFAGKTEELLRRINRLLYAKQKILVFNPIVDTRYSNKEIVSHSKKSYPALFIKKATDILDYVDDSVDCVIVDEAQFFDMEIVDVCDFLANNGIRVIVGGLDMDFRGEPFGPMPFLLAKAEFVQKLTAICPKSGMPATRSLRLINGKPANYNDPIFLLGAMESYESRSRQEHTIPGKDCKYTLKSSKKST